MLKEEKDAFENHLNSCLDCRDEFKKFELLNNVLDSFSHSEPKVSEYFTEKLLLRIKHDENKQTLFEWINQILFQRKIILISSVISVFLGIFLGILIQRQVNTITLNSSEKTFEETTWSGISESNFTEFINLQNENYGNK